MIFLAGCEFKYRYECQDPANWGKKMCNNDVCKAEGSCTTDLLGFTPSVSDKFREIDTEPTMPRFGQKFTPQGNQGISKNEGVDCKPQTKPNTFKSNQSNTFKSSQSQDSFKPAESFKRPKVDDETVGSVNSIVTENPLTMNTMVETDSHNKATKFNKW